jgi:phage terminase Nu1 subunit (DNA packaging protein)
MTIEAPLNVTPGDLVERAGGVAALFGVTVKTVFRWRRLYGLPLRGSGRIGNGRRWASKAELAAWAREKGMPVTW